MDEKHIRISEYRTASVYWTGTGTVTHLPTGLRKDYKIAWNNQIDKIRAMQELKQAIIAASPFAAQRGEE